MGIIQRQSLANALLIYSGILIGFINMYLQPVCLSPEVFGLTRVLLSFSGLVSAIMPMGAGNIMMRFFQNYVGKEEEKNRFISFTFVFGLAGFAIFSILLLLNSGWIIDSYSKQSGLFAANFGFVFLLSFFMVCISLANCYSFALAKSVVPSLFSELLIRLFLMTLVGLFYFNYIGLEGFIIGFVCSYGINFIGVMSYVFHIDKPKFRFDFGKLEWKGMAGFGIMIAIATMASIGLKNLDTIFLVRYLNLETAGIYSIALFMGLFIETPLNSLDRIASIKIAMAIAQNDQQEIKDIYHKSSSNLFLVGGLLFIGVNSCVTPLLTFLPPDYRGNELVIFIISLGSLVNMASGSNTSIIYNSEHYLKGTILLAGMFALLFILLWILIPLYGIIGSAMAIAITSSSFNLSKLLFIKRYYHMQPFGWDSVRLAILIGLVTIIGQYLPHLTLPVGDLVYRGMIVTVLYLGIAYFFKLIPEDSITMAKGLVSKVKSW